MCQLDGIHPSLYSRGERFGSRQSRSRFVIVNTLTLIDPLFSA